MRSRAFFWALVGVALLLAAIPPGARATQKSEAGSPGLAAEEKEACTRNLKIIYDAIQSYQFDHKDLPNWLSDLVPDYLADGNVLICPVCRRTGQTEQPPLADPKLACSYVFEFSPVPLGLVSAGEVKHTRREWKRRQMGLIGSAVPLVRCRHHDPVLNLGFNGAVYESPAKWELMFTNKIRATELSARSIFGIEGLPEEELTTPVVTSPKTSAPAITSTVTHPIDLSSFYTSPLGSSWLGTPGDDLSSIPRGKQNFNGIDFDVGGVVQLRGKSAVWSRFPQQVKGIPVHQRCQHIYFLHAAASDGEPQEGEQIGSYLVHLPNSQLTLEIPIYYGRSVRDWHQEKTEPAPNKELKIAWAGQNEASKRTGKSIRLFVTAWNLAPGVEIDSLDFVSAGKKAAPFLLSISFD
jgi:hypothetical protein